MSITVDRYRTTGLRHRHLKPVKVKQQRWGKGIARGKKDKQIRDVLYEGFPLFFWVVGLEVKLLVVFSFSCLVSFRPLHGYGRSAAGGEESVARPAYLRAS